MNPERAREVERISYQAMIRPAVERAEFLGRACGDDLELRREVESLVAADARAGMFMEQPLEACPPPFADGIGSRVGPYELLRKLGEGGMSVVYLAIRADDQYRKRVALKIVRHGLATEERLRRFRVERQILASLEHPSIARLLDGGATEAGLPYFVMELIEGEAIDTYCDRRRLALDGRLSLFREVCAAVHYAHRNLIVHRDLKPSNILVTAEGAPKLLDFGIAKLLNPDLALPDPHPTDTWLRAMTPEFASPEQLIGDPITTASDVYALGVVLYQLLTGRLPRRLDERSPVALARFATEAEVKRPSVAVLYAGRELENPEALARARRATPKQLARRLRGDLDNIVLSALRTEPDRRYSSAELLAEEVAHHQAGLPVRARGNEIGYRLGKSLRRHRLAVALAAGFALAVVLFVGTLIGQMRQTMAARDQAEATVRYVERMLSVADPALGVGENATVREALDRGLEQLAELEERPLLKARLQHFLGAMYADLGAYETAESLLRSALEVRRGDLGALDPVLETLNELAGVVLLRGRYAEAEQISREAYDLATRLPGESRRLAAAGLAGLAGVAAARGEQGDLSGAEHWHREALALRRELFGEGHESVAESLRSLARVRWQQGHDDEGETLYRRALGILEARFGKDHAEVASALHDLGMILHDRGDYERAEPVLRRALVLRRARLAADHPRVLDTENTLSVLLDDLGDFDGAEALQRRVLAGRVETLGDGHPLVAQSHHNLAGILTGKGEYEEARGLYREALTRARAALGDAHPGVGHILMGLGQLELTAGDPVRAEALLREAAEVRRQALPPDHWLTARSHSLLGAALAAQGRHSDAEPLLVDSLKAIRAARREGDRETREALARVVELYESWGRDHEAERHLRALGTAGGAR